MSEPKANSPGPEEPELTPCPQCGGKGERRMIDAAGSLDDEKCKDCQGRGWTRDCVPYADRDRCRSCNGTGVAMNKECEWEHCIWCNGTGRMTA